MKKEGEK